jgi:hypothetical protein
MLQLETCGQQRDRTSTNSAVLLQGVKLFKLPLIGAATLNIMTLSLMAMNIIILYRIALGITTLRSAKEHSDLY